MRAVCGSSAIVIEGFAIALPQEHSTASGVGVEPRASVTGRHSINMQSPYE